MGYLINKGTVIYSDIDTVSVKRAIDVFRAGYCKNVLRV